MGHVHVNATIRGRRVQRVRFLVDTGATYSLVSPALAKKAALVEIPVRDKVRLATGRTARLRQAAGSIRIDGRAAATIFWVGPCDEPLMGVEALEALGLGVDALRRRLKPLRPYATRLGGFGRR
jgi:clan AA aspartic protease